MSSETKTHFPKQISSTHFSFFVHITAGISLYKFCSYRKYFCKFCPWVFFLPQYGRDGNTYSSTCGHTIIFYQNYVISVKFRHKCLLFFHNTHNIASFFLTLNCNKDFIPQCSNSSFVVHMNTFSGSPCGISNMTYTAVIHNTKSCQFSYFRERCASAVNTEIMVNKHKIIQRMEKSQCGSPNINHHLAYILLHP